MRRYVPLAAEIIAVALPIITGVAIACTAVDIPFWDEWEWAELIIRLHDGTLTFADLWHQHNEHRLFFPQLILIGLDRVGGWSPIREQFVSLALVVGAQIGLTIEIYRTSRGWPRALATVVTAVFLYGAWQAENFTWGFQLAWFLCNAACVGVVVLLAAPHRSRRATALALVLAVVASFSSSQGLLVWPAGAVAILCARRAARRTIAVWIFAATATALVYLHDLTPGTHGHIDIVRQPLEAANYALAYLGSAVVGWAGVTVSAIAGSLLVAALLAFAITDLRHPLRGRALARRGPWYALASYPLCAAVATASGRAGLGLDGALSSRYTSLSGLAGIALVCIAATALRDGSRARAVARRQRWALGAALVVLTACVIRSETGGWHAWRRTDAMFAQARADLERDDPVALAKLYPDVLRIELLMEGLRRVHDGPFHHA
jgi:hypothetical protein